LYDRAAIARLIFSKGILVGVLEGSRKTARRMTKDGFTPGQIRKYTGLSLKDILGLGGKS
jgi:hypothetical protein